MANSEKSKYIRDCTTICNLCQYYIINFAAARVYMSKNRKGTLALCERTMHPMMRLSFVTL